MEVKLLFCFCLPCLILMITTTKGQNPGFLSLDCGGMENFTDDLGLEWVSDNKVIFSEIANVSVLNETRKQYMTLRYFPADDRKYCYTLDVKTRTRYLLRASFLYGNFDNNNVYPKFDISVGATHWSTIVISDANMVEELELIFLASSPTIAVCLSNATTGQPFISTLELRQFNNSVYYTEFEQQFFLSVSARINFGALSEDPVRYPDDPFDRIWKSDSIKKANYLVDVADGTEKISTTAPIDINRDERPPEKVMQTAVVGTKGMLTYRLNLEGFPGFGWAFSYFAEIEELGPNDARKFRLILPGMPELTKASVNIQENALGKNRLYEPGYTNISLPFVCNFKFNGTTDTVKGPLLNAMEISKYVEINNGALDVIAINGLISHYALADWAQEGGDPCLPVTWSWLKCNSDPQPRIISIKLSKKNLTGNIPSEIASLPGLVELWLDGNSFTGPILDFSGSSNLQIIHLENNGLTGSLPSSLSDLPNLKELYLQNNRLSGNFPSSFADRNIVLNYSGNNLHPGGGTKNNKAIIIGTSVGGVVLLVATIVSCLLLKKKKNKHYGEDKFTSLPPQKLVSSMKREPASETAHSFTFAEIEDATEKFEKRIGSGGFGVVYYGKLKDEKEIAVKVLTNNSFQGKREFANEVTLLSRIHHRNLVQFLGYCHEEQRTAEARSILVYEFMHNGTLKEHLYGPIVRGGGSISWIKRLEIAEDAAKGIEYLHTGCIPTIIHRDLKSSNILLDKHMRAKVSDFGLSKIEIDGVSHVSSVVRGTVGYLDPEYYISQQLTEKSDIYSFGVILLELISGKEAISNESFGANCRNIVQWAKTHIQNGQIQAIIDPLLGSEYNIRSIWNIAEKAMLCVQSHGSMRPSISEVLKEIQDTILIEKQADASGREVNFDDISRTSLHSSLILGTGSMDLSGAEPSNLLFDDPSSQPLAR